MLILLFFVISVHAVLSEWIIGQRHVPIENPIQFKLKTKQLLSKLQEDITQEWTYEDLFYKTLHIGITPELVQKSFSNLGDEARLQLLFLKALRGQRVNLPVIGGSISRGATFSEDHQGNRIFFHAITDWWNRIFGPISGSRMYPQSISLGGVGTDYYGYCLNAHLHEDNLPKLILWELAANDRGRYDDKPFPSGQPLEQLTRNILQRTSKPAFLMVNFFRGHDYLGGKCLNYEDEGGLRVARHYRITSISWRNFVCENIKKKIPLFTMHEIFGTDDLHPSILGHAQMAFLIINYLKGALLRMLNKFAIDSQSIGQMEQRILNQGELPLPNTLFHETSSHKPRCFTYFLYNEYYPNNTLSVAILREDDYHYNVFKKFNVRTDKLAGLQTNQSEQLLTLQFKLPEPYSKLVLVTHSQTGNGQVWVDHDTPVLVETWKYHMGTKIEIVSTNIKAGSHQFNALSLKHGFCVSALAVI